MKKNHIIVFAIAVLALSTAASARSTLCADSLYRRPLKDVLLDVQQRFGVRLKFSPKDVDGLTLTYADWRIRPYDVDATLSNILDVFDLNAVEESEGVYKIRAFEYPRRLPAEGKRLLGYLITLYHDRASWELRRDSLRTCMRSAVGLALAPPRPASPPALTPLRKFEGYTVQNFALEVLPGVYTCGSIYRPARAKQCPIVLNPNGHFAGGRYRDDQQIRCAMQARMGAISVSYDLFAWGESLLQFDGSAHRHSVAHALQTLNAVRILDYLCTLREADTARVAITGGSGGGSQAMLVAALDSRIKVCIPVVMLSSYFMGGCPCESGLPVHLCGGGTCNAELAAMFAPRPQLVLSDGKDWTSSVPTVELPYLKRIYGFYGQSDNLQNVHFPSEGHDYGASKRAATYRFLAQHLGLNLQAALDAQGKVDESRCTVEPQEALLVFGKNGERLPANAIKSVEVLEDMVFGK